MILDGGLVESRPFPILIGVSIAVNAILIGTHFDSLLFVFLYSLPSFLLSLPFCYYGARTNGNARTTCKELGVIEFRCGDRLCVSGEHHR
jgi:hypothetical protein